MALAERMDRIDRRSGDGSYATMKIEYQDVYAFYAITGAGEFASSSSDARNPVAIVLYRLAIGFLNYMNWPKDQRKVPASRFQSGVDSSIVKIGLSMPDGKAMYLELGLSLRSDTDKRTFDVKINGIEVGYVNVDDDRSLAGLYERISVIVLDNAQRFA